MESGDLTQIVRRKIEDIQRLIKHSDKDSTLRKLLDSQFTEILTEEHKVSGSGSTISGGEYNQQKENSLPLLERLVSFRKYIINQITVSAVIRSPTVSLKNLKPEEVQMSLDRTRLTSLQNGDGDSSDSSSDDEDIFEERQIKKNSVSFNGKNGFGTNNLPEKRIRKQVIRPDFVSSFKKIKMDQERERDDGRSSSNEGESPPPNSNGLSVEFPCPVCKKIFRKKGHMTRHLLTHEPEKPFGCDFCSKRFAAKYSLQMHLLNRHNTDAKPFECVQCDKRFTLKKELDQHILSHKDGFKPRNYPCHLCELKFITKDDLDSHLETHPEANIYHCGHCDKSFPRKYNLTRHERTHSTEKPYHCDVCNKDFGTKNGLHMHLQAHETDENKPLICHLCNKRFTVEQNLELHISFHNQSDEKPFPCDLCEVRFKTQERLEKHFETHGSIEGRVYPCQYCEKTFPRKYNLVRHELSHTHGRRKPKDGLPTSIRHDYRHGDDGDGTDDENCGMDSGTYYDENNKNDLESNNRYCYSYNSISSKSELFSTFFGVGDGFFSDNNIEDPTDSSEQFSIVKFENY